MIIPFASVLELSDYDNSVLPHFTVDVLMCSDRLAERVLKEAPLECLEEMLGNVVQWCEHKITIKGEYDIELDVFTGEVFDYDRLTKED